MAEKPNKKILVIDDDADVRSFLKIRLEANQFDVTVASDGDEGFAKLQLEKSHLVVLDVMMPGMDGYTFIRKMKADPSLKDIPIIVLTSRTGMKDLFEVEGASDYMTKPYDAAELIKKINRYFK